MIPVPTRAGRRWQMVWQGPSLGFGAETRRFVAMETLLACCCALLPTSRVSFFYFTSFFFLYPGMFLSSSCPFVCSSHLLLLASTYSVVFYSTCFSCLSFVPYPISEFYFFNSFSVVFRSSYFSCDVFVLCSRTRYAST